MVMMMTIKMMTKIVMMTIVINYDANDGENVTGDGDGVDDDDDAAEDVDDDDDTHNVAPLSFNAAPQYGLQHGRRTGL